MHASPLQIGFSNEGLSYSPEFPPQPGMQIVTASGRARVTRLEPMGKEVLIWADYGSGIEQPHGREGVTCNLKIVLGGEGEMDGTSDLESQTGSPSDADPLALKPQTKACGWIGWKETKRERKNRDAWICRQAWLYWEEPGGKKRSRYIPKAKLAMVEESVYGLRRPIYETLELLEKKWNENVK